MPHLNPDIENECDRVQKPSETPEFLKLMPIPAPIELRRMVVTIYANFVNYYANAQDTIITGSDEFGIKLNGCNNITFDDITISDNTEHGMELLSSSVKFLDAVAGTGNGGAGIYAHSGSEVIITSGNTPTLTGTVGNIAISDPTIEDATWADVDAGNEVAIAQEMTIVKEG